MRLLIGISTCSEIFCKIVAENKLLYEFFSLAGTDTLQPDRIFHAKFGSESTPKLKTVSKDQKLEDQIQGTKDDDAFHFF